MATLTPAQLELARSLTQEELPTKLRCAICSKLAVNAFRLPCCETAICENCQSTLPSSCPVCEHSPVSASDCIVYKSLRTTIRVFIKTEEKKREAMRPKANGSTPTTPAQATPTPTPTQDNAPSNPPAAESSVREASNPPQHPPDDAKVEESKSSVEPESNPPAEEATTAQPDNAEAGGQPPEEHHAENENTEESGPQEQVTEDTTGEEGAKGDAAEATADQAGQTGMNFGFDPMNNNFNMNFGNGDMTQMQMMMAMQNGMNPAGFGSFPMMGMMDPMMMQNMMMSGGFGAQGMGMNGMNMNMNMGMNGFNGGGEDWSGQQSWNVGQDNFNPNASGMGNGDYGNFNSNFRTGNYGHQNQFNDYRRGNYGFRGRGRGRGFYNGYGRGGYQNNYNHQNTAWADGQLNGAVQPVGGASGELGTPGPSGNVDEFGRTIRTDQSQDGQAAGQDEQSTVTPPGTHSEVVKALVSGSEETQGDKTSPDGDVSSRQTNGIGRSGSVPLQRIAPDVPLNAPTGPKAMRQGLPNTSLHHLRARGFIRDERTPSLGTNGPGVPNPLDEKSRSSSLQSHKDKDRRPHDRHPERDVDEISRAEGHDRDRARSRTRSISKGRSPSPRVDRASPNPELSLNPNLTPSLKPNPDQNISHSRSRSRSRSRDRKESRRHKRHRSTSISGDSRDGDHRRRRHISKRHSNKDDDEQKGRSRGDRHEGRSRSASPTDREHKRSSHRSHRDRERERDRDRDRDREERRRDRDKDRDKNTDHDRHRKASHRSSHRERVDDRERDRDRDRDRDRGRDRDRERERDRDRTRDKERDRDRDRDREHRNHDRKGSSTAPPVETSSKPFNPPTGPRGGLSIKGSSGKASLEIRGANNRSSDSRREDELSRRASQSSATGGQRSASGTAGKDPHTLEREARDRERLLKEAQRIAGMAAISGRNGGKRSRDAGDDRGGRRKSRRSEAVSMDDEARMRRIEAEREGRRWD
ncbi:hypothetical protein GGS20DRAFT_522263 [Poronia punctata]|nr:hypothetical protein GGS20DRAFT_522263 [Poronia punctata]